MSETKRKRSHKEHQERPAKRVALDSSTTPIKVSFVSNVDEWVPVLGNKILALHLLCVQVFTKQKLKLSSHQSRPFFSSWNIPEAI